MRVLHVIPSVNPALGGPTQVVLNLVKALRDCDVDAEIVTTNDKGAELLDVPLNQRIEYEQVPVWFLPRFLPPMREFIFSVALTRWLRQHIRNYDILDNHYLFSYAPTCAGIIARRQGVPYTIRTMGQLSPSALEYSRFKKQIYTFLIERRNLNHAAAIHCTSTGEVEDVRKFGVQTPIITLPLGVNQPHTCPNAKQQLRQVYGLSQTTPILLLLARLHPVKRPELLLQALSQLASQNHDFHLILAGSGEPEYLTHLTHLVTSLGLACRTSLPGFVTGQDKELLLQGSDIFVLPSFTENFGIAIAEAMAAGLPVIVTTNVRISPEIAEAKAGLVVEGDVEPLKNAIATLLTSPHLRSALGENGKRLVNRRYSWKAIASHLKDAYHSVSDRQPLPQHLAFD